MFEHIFTGERPIRNLLYPCPVRITSGGALNGEKGEALGMEREYIRVKVLGFRSPMLFPPDEIEAI